MAVIPVSEYDISYFEGRLGAYTHNAGYTNYGAVNYPSKGNFVPIEQSTGRFIWDLIKHFNILLNNRFVGKTVLVVGCAYGDEVKAFRDLGVLATGIDVSNYAITQGKALYPDIASYLIEADARTIIPTYHKNEWDYIFSKQLLECMSDADLATLIPAMNNACKNDQCHFVQWDGDPGADVTGFEIGNFYNLKILTEWAAMPFSVGTILIHALDVDNYITVIN